VPFEKAWWWRNLESWAKAVDAFPADKRESDIYRFNPVVHVIENLRWAEKTPLINEVLATYLDREIEHRIDGGGRWREYPHAVWLGDAHPIIQRADAAAAPLEITVTVRADANVKDATAVFLEAFKQARANIHKVAPPLTPSNRIRSINTWPHVFKVIEYIDRRLAGEHVDNDDFAQARAFLRERNLTLREGA
jgi:hypothetical protein